MQKEIKYTGFTETPSDYECPDGDLATVVGMVPEDAAMKPIQEPTTLFTLPEGYTVVFIHKNTGFRHFIVCHDDDGAKSYYWLANFEPQQVFMPEDFNEDNLISSFDDGREVYELNALGNTLIVLTDDGVEYYLWKTGELLYKPLGSNMPELYLSFGLNGEVVDGDESTFYIPREIARQQYIYDYDAGRESYNAFYSDEGTFTNDAFIDSVTEGLLGSINKYIKDKSTNKGKFLFPFFVRYAYKLYDESTAMASAPILMMANAGDWSPRAYITDRALGKNMPWGDEEYIGDNKYAVAIRFKSRARAVLFDLDYKAIIPDELEDWKDVIKSVEIYISAPLYTYNQAGKVTGFKSYLSDMEGYTVATVDNNYYRRHELIEFIPNWTCDYDGHRCEFLLPHFVEDTIKNNVSSARDFYKLKSIALNKLETERTKIVIDNGYLETLTQQERLIEDYNSHDKLIAKHSFVYNRRLHLANLQRVLAPSLPPIAIANYSNVNMVKYDIFVYIDHDGEEIIVQSPDSLNISYLEDGNPFVYFYYPNPNAKKVVIKKYTANNQVTVYEFQLTPHDFLNGAVYFESWDPEVTPSTEVPVPSVDRKVPIPNKLYTSEVDNPFLFLPRGIQTVGVGTIIGVRPIVKAMSLAQYGQHDLYVFSTDGVWSLEVDSEGYMQHPHLATPDIVLGDGESITQIDGAVLFATDRGIMLISGSDSICLSDVLNSTTPFRPIGDTPADDLLPGLRNVAGERLESMQLDLFRNFIKDCRMVYDYHHQRIIVYSPTHDYAYVYSLKSKQWGMMPSKIRSTPLDYPAALTIVDGADSQNVLTDYAKDDEQQGVIRVASGLIITRPLKLDYPDVLKTVDTVIQRGKFHTGHIKSILYGSRDLYNWQLVWSSVDQYLRGFSGTPYKYFCLALICDMEEGEDLTGCTVQFTPRLTDQLR